MKKIEAIIRHFKLEEVASALIPLGISGLTASEGRGAVSVRSRPAASTAEFLPKVLVEIVVPDELVWPVVDVILRTARTGQAGDGKVLVADVTQAVHIRTGKLFDATLKASA